MNNIIIKSKAYDETKIYLQSIFFDKCITDEIKQTITDLYSKLTIDNSYEIQKQAQDLLSESRKILRENRLSKNRLEDQPIFQGFIGFMIILGLISYILSQSILDSDKNQKSSKIWNNIIKNFIGVAIFTIILYCLCFNFIYHNV
jgi:membrane-associated HD superfamily phosphohydrolase